jgi:hypothetical protein
MKTMQSLVGEHLPGKYFVLPAGRAAEREAMVSVAIAHTSSVAVDKLIL